MATRVIDDSKLQSIAVAIQGKDGGGQMTVDEMPGRIDNINVGGDVPNPDDPLLLVDWDGTTLLYSYTYEDAQQISEFPDAPTHEGLTFQSWNWSEVIAKTWLQNHRGAQLRVYATYTPTDGQSHNYWRTPRIDWLYGVYMHHSAKTDFDTSSFSNWRALSKVSLSNGATNTGSSDLFLGCTSLIEVGLPNSLTTLTTGAFANCTSLRTIVLPPRVNSIGRVAFSNCCALSTASLPDSVTTISNNAFEYCVSLNTIELSRNLTHIGACAFSYCGVLEQIDIPANTTYLGTGAFSRCSNLVDVILRSKPTLASSDVFDSGLSSQRFYVHRSDLAWFETATNWSAIYGEGKIVAAADYIEYLQSIGIDTTDFEGE